MDNVPMRKCIYDEDTTTGLSCQRGRQVGPIALAKTGSRLLALADAERMAAARFAGECRRPWLAGRREAVLVRVPVQFVDAEFGLGVPDAAFVEDIDLFWRFGRVDREHAAGDRLVADLDNPLVAFVDELRDRPRL